MEDDDRWSSMSKSYCQPACKELDGKEEALAKTDQPACKKLDGKGEALAPLSAIEGKPGRAAWRWRRTQPIPAMLMEDDGRWSSMGKIYCQPACKELDGKGVALAKTALMQKQMGLAA